MSDAKGLAPIDPRLLYPLPYFKNVTGMSDSAMRSARHNGLKIKYAGQRGFVLGKDWIDYVTEHGRDEK